MSGTEQIRGIFSPNAGKAYSPPPGLSRTAAYAARRNGSGSGECARRARREDAEVGIKRDRLDSSNAERLQPKLFAGNFDLFMLIDFLGVANGFSPAYFAQNYQTGSTRDFVHASDPDVEE
jgi:hypothetical protein